MFCLPSPRLSAPAARGWAWQASDGGWQLFSGDVCDRLDLLYESRGNAQAKKTIESPEFGEVHYPASGLSVQLHALT
jgi:hypothetical protein